MEPRLIDFDLMVKYLRNIPLDTNSAAIALLNGDSKEAHDWAVYALVSEYEDKAAPEWIQALASDVDATEALSMFYSNLIENEEIEAHNDTR